MGIKISFDRLLYCEYGSRAIDRIVSAINLQYGFPDKISGCRIVDLLVWIVSYLSDQQKKLYTL